MSKYVTSAAAHSSRSDLFVL